MFDTFGLLCGIETIGARTYNRCDTHFWQYPVLNYSSAIKGLNIFNMFGIGNGSPNYEDSLSHIAWINLFEDVSTFLEFCFAVLFRAANLFRWGFVGANCLAVALFTEKFRISCNMSEGINEVASSTTHGLCFWILPLCSRLTTDFARLGTACGHIKVVQRRYSICRQLDDQLTLLQYCTNLPTGLCTGSTLEKNPIYHHGNNDDWQSAHHHNYREW